MSGILRLDEKHKRCVELIIRGTPRNEIAAELDVSRSTVFAWMNDPLVQAYYEKLALEMQAARRMRLLASFIKTVDLFDAGVKEAFRQLQSDDPAERLKAPTLTSIATVLKTVYAMERTDAGNPSQISETQHTVDAGGPKKRSMFEQLMDAVVVEGGPVTLEVEPEEDKA